MSLSKNRKVVAECRIFNDKWSIDYFMVENKNTALCLICNETIAVLKEYNIRRHYDSRHACKYSKLTGKLRSDKVHIMKKNLTSQRQIFTKRTQQNKSTLRASFQVVHILAKAGKPFTDGQLIKNCILKTVEEICPDKVSLFSAISLSPNTVARRTEDLGANIIRQFTYAASGFECFSIALDESTDVSDSAQVLLFVRGVSNSFEITEELAAVHSMESTVTGGDLFLKVKETVSNLGLDFKNLKCVTTDGGRNMCGTKTGLVGNICNAVTGAGADKPMILHCIIHQQALCGKHMKISDVMDVVVQTVNFIRSHSLTHRQFKNFLAEIDSEYQDVPYHCEVRWLSRGKVLERFFQLRAEIDIFMTDKNRPVPELSDVLWIWKLAFIVDLTEYINDLNLKLQGENSLISDLYSHVKAFRQKLILFEKQLAANSFVHFATCGKFTPENNDVPFPTTFALEIIAQVRQNFQDRFQDFDHLSGNIRLFQNPFACEVEDLPPELQLEVIELTSNDTFKNYFNEGNLLKFYSLLPEKPFKNLKDFARGMFSAFGSTYLCEQTFSKMKYIKSKYRTALSDKHLKSILLIGTSKFEPNWGDILCEKQFQTSH